MNPTLKLDPNLADDVVSGIKTMTVRAGYRDYKLGNTEFEIDSNWNSETLPIFIHKIEEVFYSTLDAEYQETLLEYYPDLQPQSVVTIVRFTYNP